MYIDAHCHLERETYGEELEAVLERAFAAGLTHLVCVGASRGAAGAREVVGLAEKHPRVFAAVAIHPHEAKDATPAQIQAIEALLEHPKVVSLGETGLDYYYDFSPREPQRQVCRRMLELARQADLPLTLHVRDAHGDMCALLDETGLPERGGVVHCFTSGPAEAEAYLARGLHICIPGVVTFKKAEPLREAVRMIPEDRLLVETDAPYLAPVPHRGKRNEPALLPLTAEAVGKLKGRSGAEMGRITRENTLRLFALPHEL